MRSRVLVIDALAYEKGKAFGYQEYLFNLLNYFFENRNELIFDKIIIVCDKKQYDDFSLYKEKFIIKGFNGRNLFSRHLIQLLMPYILKLKKTDTILFLGNISSLIKSCKYILVIHDLLYIRKKLLPNLLMRFQRRTFVPRSISIANATIAISDFTRNDILKNIKCADANKIYKIYNYFNFKKYSVFCNNEKINYNSKYFLTISSTAYHKNVITILRAFEKYCDFNKDVDLFFVGYLGNAESFVFYNKLNDSVKKRIHILSNISNYEISKLYLGCEAYISATLFEGLGMPIVEAMYFNAPLILSDLEICKEVSNEHAIFFNPRDFQELFEILLDYKKEKTDTKTLVMDKFSAFNTSQKYIDLLNAI